MMLKVTDNPPMLFPEGQSIEEMSGRWWVARTKARNEKALAWWLARWQVPYFLPLRERVHRRKRGSYKCLVPLFGGYVFLCGDDEQRYVALRSNRIAQVLEVVDQAGLVWDLSQIHEAIRRGAVLGRHRYLEKGTRCRVVAGALAGLEGVVERTKNTLRLVLQVDMLGQAAAVEIDAEDIEPVA